MSGRLAALLVRLHDPVWRERFGAECCEVLAELPASPGILADMVLSAAVSRRAFLVRTTMAAAIAVLLAVSATLAFGRTGVAAGIAVLHGPRGSAQPN